MNVNDQSDEQIAKVYLIDCDDDAAEYRQLLDACLEANSFIPSTADGVRNSVERGLAQLREAQGKSKKVIVMFVRDKTNETFLPFISNAFDADDADYVSDTVDAYFDFFVQCGNHGFQFKTISPRNRVLALCIQALFENHCLQAHLSVVKG